MAENEQVGGAGDQEEPELTPGYKPPAQKSLSEIVSQDTDDEALEKYKQSLLGGATPGAAKYPNDPRKVIVEKLALCAEGRDPIELDLTGDLSKLKKEVIVIKEGCKYQVKIYFYVQRDIVTGLRYFQKSYRKGIKVDSASQMVGSYGPKETIQEYKTPMEDAPSGMLARGSYTMKSQFTDDDKNNYLEWEWTLDIKKDWAQ